VGSPLYSSRTKIGVASIVCDNPETRTVRLLFAEATCRVVRQWLYVCREVTCGLPEFPQGGSC
jgi:hypothetical protein